MRSFSSNWVKYMCAGLILTAPFAASPGAQAATPVVTIQSVADQLGPLLPKAKKVVEKTVDFFSLTDIPVHVNITGENKDTWHIRIDVQSAQSIRKSIPQSVYIKLSVGGKLERLDLAWKDDRKDRKPDKHQALSVADDFVAHVLDYKLTAAREPEPFSGTMVLVPLYPVVNDITVEDEAAYVLVDASGQLRSFQSVEPDIKIDHLPKAKDVIALEEAKQAFADQLTLELVFDDENSQFLYAASPYSGVDAKTGDELKTAYRYSDEIFTLEQDKKPAAMTAEKVKLLSGTYAGIKKDSLKVTSSRSSHPNEAAKTAYRVADGTNTLTLFSDEQTGQLLSITVEREESPVGSHKTTRAVAKQQAIQFLDEFLTMKKGEYVLRERYLEEGQRSDMAVGYQLDVYPVHNGVRAAKPTVTIGMEREGNVIAFVTTRPFEWQNAAKPALMAMDEAKGKWLQELPFGLHYLFPEVDSPRAEQAKLAYMPGFDAASRFIHAVSGKWEKATDW